jgi:glycosyltransferase involved in cell wall biosynthesis
VIASAATSNLEVVTDRVNGRLVAPLDAGAWALAIEELLGVPEQGSRLALAARETARVTFALEHTVRRTARLYEDVLTRFPQPRTRVPGAAAW